MQEDVRLDELVVTVAKLFQADPTTLSDESSSQTVKGWDSLGQIRLMYELEERYGVEFDLLQIAELKSIGKIRQQLKAKGIAC
jgi:acyl carrier protein